METAKGNSGLCSVLCFLYQSIRYKIQAEAYAERLSLPEVTLAQPRSASQHQVEAFSSAVASFMPPPCRVCSCCALGWRTKPSHCRGLQTSSWLRCTIKSQRAVPWQTGASCDFLWTKGQRKQTSWEGRFLSPKRAESRISGNGRIFLQMSLRVGNQ